MGEYLKWVAESMDGLALAHRRLLFIGGVPASETSALTVVRSAEH